MESLIKPIAFYIFAAVAVVSAILVVMKKNPIASAMNLVVTFFCLAGLYVLLNSQFIAIMQVLVYAGAIMMLIVFVIMLLNLRQGIAKPVNKPAFKVFIVVIFALLMFISLAGILTSGQVSGVSGGITNAKLAEVGTIQLISRSMFSEYLLPFELTSLLLTVAIIGAVVLAKGMLAREKGPQAKKSDTGDSK